MAEDDEQPGFRPAGALAHVGGVRQCVPAGGGAFASLTSTALRVWAAGGSSKPGAASKGRRGGGGGPATLAQLALPADLISAVAPAPRAGLLLGAALDNTLRVWSLDRLAQRSACAWDAGTVLQLVHNPMCALCTGVGRSCARCTCTSVRLRCAAHSLFLGVLLSGTSRCRAAPRRGRPPPCPCVAGTLTSSPAGRLA